MFYIDISRLSDIENRLPMLLAEIADAEAGMASSEAGLAKQPNSDWCALIEERCALLQERKRLRERWKLDMKLVRRSLGRTPCSGPAWVAPV